MRRIFVILLAVCMLASGALAEPCIAKDGTCPQVVSPTRVFVPAEGGNTGDIAASIRPVVSEMSLLPWNGAVVVGTLPKDAEIAETLQNDIGYAQTLRYDGAVSIVTARFGSVEARDAYVLANYLPAGVYEVLDTQSSLSNPLHIRYTGENAAAVDVFYFADPENYFLFLVAVDADAEQDYADFIQTWISGLAVFKP